MPKLDEFLRISKAHFLGVCVETLRNWEEGGVLMPRFRALN